jgi:glucosamine-6-phosphate deaminase
MTISALRRFDRLPVIVHPDARRMGRAAAEEAAAALRAGIAERGRARAIFAAANSQLPLFAALRELTEVDWSCVEAFHMDEYLGLDGGHPASFRSFLDRHLVSPLGIGTFHRIDGAPGAVEATVRDYAARLAAAPIDLCCMGIGENGHLAFNDPPVAEFADPRTIKVVPLDAASRRQQVGEGHFADLDVVPTHALTLTIPALLGARRVVVVVPDARKAAAVAAALLGPIAPSCPASVLRTIDHATLHLDPAAAGHLPPP